MLLTLPIISHVSFVVSLTAATGTRSCYLRSHAEKPPMSKCSTSMRVAATPHHNPNLSVATRQDDGPGKMNGNGTRERR